MKITMLTFVCLGLWLGTAQTTMAQTQSGPRPANELLGEWDNFQQVWLENTDTDMHRVETSNKHRHYHVSVSAGADMKNFDIAISEGRNGKNPIEKMVLSKAELMNSENVRFVGDTLSISGFKHFDNDGDPYKFIRARMFSGWIQYPVEQFKDSTYFKRDLQMHDQGGMVELDIDGVDYTVELTQLVYGKQLKLMKIAIYDMPLDSVGINSTSISYAWTSPEASRLGINLRKIVSGWTLIEPDCKNSNTMRKKEE